MSKGTTSAQLVEVLPNATSGSSNNTEDSQLQQQNSVLLSVKVARGRNIKGAKGDHVNSFVRVQFADFDFKDSEVIVDTSSPEFDFSWKQQLHIDESLIDSFWNKKVSITVIESLPKEKTSVLGTAEACLGARFLKYPLKNPEEPDAPVGPPPPLSFKETINVAYLNTKLVAVPAAKPGQGDDASSGQPEIDIEVSISKLLIQPEIVENGNFMTFKVDDLLPVPEEWSLREGNEKDLNTNIFSYTLNFMMPAVGSTERLISIPMGSLVNSETSTPQEPSISAIYQNKTANSSTSSGSNGINGGNKPSQLGSSSDENSSANISVGEKDLKSTDQANSQQANAAAGNGGAAAPVATTAAPASFSASGPKKISWGGVNHVVWMSPDAIARLREKISQKAPLEIEFVRELLPKFAHVSDIHVNKYRGKIILDGSSLLYPRVVGLKGRFSMDVYTGEPRPHTAVTDLPSTANPPVSTPIAPTVGEKEGKKANAKGKEDGKTGTKKSREFFINLYLTNISTLLTKTSVQNLYKNLGSTICLEVTLEKPLLDKKRLQPVDKSVRDFIPRRVIPPNLLFEKRAKKADEQYHAQISDIVKKLAKEYEGVIKAIAQDSNGAGSSTGNILGSTVFSNTPSGSRYALDDDFKVAESVSVEQQRKKAFFFHLNKSGVYFHMKEELKAAITDVVRERFKKKSPFAVKAEMQLFLSEVYVYLTDQMHIAINKIFNESITSSQKSDSEGGATTDHENLKSFANSAEADGLIYVASSHHKERVAKFENNMDVWFDYGCFCMRTNMEETGEECFKHILSIKPNHVPSLLAYGAICAEAEKYEEARVYLHTAITFEPKSSIALTVLALYYGSTGEDEEGQKYMEMALEAHKSQFKTIQSHLVAAAEFLVQVHAGQLAEKALSEEILSTGPKIQNYVILSKLEQQRGNYKVAFEHLQDALKLKQDSPDIWAAIGNIYYLRKNWKEAQNAYETVLTLTQEATNMALVYIRLGNIYLQFSNIARNSVNANLSKNSIKSDNYLFRQAKTMFMRGCEISPSSIAWLGVGKACMGLEDLKEAEDALSEANVLNNRSSEVWAYLALLCLKTDRKFEANQCIAQMLRIGLKDAFVLKQVGQALLDSDETTPAINCFQKSLEYMIDELSSVKYRKSLMENAAKDIQKLSNGGNNSIQMDEDVSKKARHQSEIQRLIEQSELNMDEEQHLTYEIESVKDFLSKTLQVRGGKEDRPQLKDVSSNPSTDMYGARPSGFAL